ncbi:translation initiation factor IF-2 [Candidatus Desulfovibrio trichonymphae]|uniref:Translation initiation factor IF-2 n=1 Tax=Candidatus Desulfovibrio trichonymphae TaxID=1725232 RepID=A0A1J1DWR1_9BACT|nr:translation initiation factor IF-2 [Candidatus Desulfovibrio trichonymphae]BAV91542.1 translation initiation factor IF-2 [Candidatus Desulfovibrio trichonymphae]
MPEEKIKIKDIAAELEVQPKDMLRALRKLGLPAKSTASSISLDDATRVRDHFTVQKQQDVERTEIQRDIIVRRRRARQSSSASDHQRMVPDQTPEPVIDKADASAGSSGSEKQAASAPLHVADKTEMSDTTHTMEGDIPIVGNVPAAEETPPAASVDEVAATEQKPTQRDLSRTKKSVSQTSPARVVSRPDDDTPDVVETQSSDTDKSEQSHFVAAEPNGKISKTSRLTRPDASAVPDGSSAPTLSSRPAEMRAKDSGADGEHDANALRAKLISRPAPSSQEHSVSRPAGGRPAAVGAHESGPRPDGQRGPRSARMLANSVPGGSRSAPMGQQTPASPMDTRDGQSKKKRLKGRRTVDFQQDAFGRRQDDDDSPRLNRGKGRRKNSKLEQQTVQQTQPLKAAKRKIRITEAIRVADMAHQMGLKGNEIIKVLFGLGVMATINQSLDIDTATLVAAEFSYEVEKIGFSEDDYLFNQAEDRPESLKPRPPIVTIMGHVDHGKTSLLDAIRRSNITSGEAGGITQHIGAYHVKTKRGEVVFLDTPGHEAFTAMRARGAQITDLVILVVAADDGVMEQTREAINHSRAANVPIMVAVNKMDKSDADPDRVLRELSELGLQPEDWGGDTIVAKVSAKTRQGLDELLEMVALQSELMELKANPDKAAHGHIVEARLDKGRGPIATLLIQAGTLKQGDSFVCGHFSGRVRALMNDQGKKVKEAGPSLPVEVQGFEGVPEAGEEFFVMSDEKVARRIADTRAAKQRERALASESRITLETFLSSSASAQKTLTLNLVIKADVQGSLEAIAEALNKQSTEKMRLHIMHGGAGAITESDILLASASQAIIIGFNVRPTAKIKDIAEHENVDIRFYNIIYKLVDDIRSAMTGMLAPVQREVYLGQAAVRKIYSVPKVGIIAGSYVEDGKIVRHAGARLLRDGVVIYTGKIDSLKRFKDDAREVVKGNECGVGLESFNDIKDGDIIEAFETIEEAATL